MVPGPHSNTRSRCDRHWKKKQADLKPSQPGQRLDNGEDPGRGRTVAEVDREKDRLGRKQGDRQARHVRAPLRDGEQATGTQAGHVDKLEVGEAGAAASQGERAFWR